MELAVVVFKVLQAIHDLKSELDSNHAEANRLCERCLSAKAPLQILLKSPHEIESKKNALESFVTTVNEVNLFVSKFKEKTMWRTLTKVAFRKNLHGDIWSLNMRLNQCLLDLQLGMSVDSEIQRREDLKDTRDGFDAAVKMTLREIELQGENAQELLTELKQSIENNQNTVVELLQQRNYAPLNSSELQAIRQDNEALSILTVAKLDEVLSAIRGLEAGQNHVIHLIESMSLNATQKQTRAEMVAKLELSYSDVNKGNSPIAEGAFGDVYVGLFRRSNKVALKVLRNKNLQSLSAKQIHGAQSEVLLMDYLKDPSIVTCYGFVPDAKQLVIVLELAPYGSLWDIVSNHVSFPVLPFTLSLAWLCDMCDAVRFIHSKQVVHKDIKCENYLVFSGLKVKLTDFGLSKHDTGGPQSTVAGAGTGAFRAPEVRSGRSSSPSSDMFSFAMTAVQLFARSHPAYDDTSDQIDRAILSTHSDVSAVDPDTVHALHRLVVKSAFENPSKRPASAEVAHQLSELTESCGDPRVFDCPVTAEVETKASQLAKAVWSSGQVVTPKGGISSTSQKIGGITSAATTTDGGSAMSTLSSLSAPSLQSEVDNEHDADIAVLSQWLQENADCRPQDALFTAKNLCEHAVYSVEKLAKALKRDPQFLVDIGVKKVVADDIKDALQEIEARAAAAAAAAAEKERQRLAAEQVKAEAAENEQHRLASEQAKAEAAEKERQILAAEQVAAAVSGPQKITFDNGDVYEGSVTSVNGTNVPHGHGMMSANNGDVYEGEWQMGLKHGQGILKYSRTDDKKRDVYEGEFVNDQRHGQGVVKWTHGQVYEGEWKDGKQHGQGVQKYADGRVYEGEWEDDKRHGQGVMKNADGHVYEGKWKDDRKHGQGVYKWPEGRVYEGEWGDDKKHGQGVMKYASGQVYEGEWKDDKKHGQGVYKWPEGEVYEGKWNDDKMHGQGVMKWPDGRVYEGQWKDGKHHGQGVMKYADGQVYVGEWHDAKMHGQGVMKYVNGQVYEGEWKDDKWNGQGVMKYANGSVYEGEWKDGKWNGQGVMKYANGSVYKDANSIGQGAYK